MDSDDKLTIYAIALCTLALAAYQFGFIAHDGIGFMVPCVGGYFHQF
jgi:hypothetical protein